MTLDLPARIPLGLALALASVAACAEALPGVGRAEVSLSTLDGERSYVAYVPKSAPDQDAALVIALHGLGGSGADVIDQGRWDQAANTHGFIVLGPDGTLEHPRRRASFLGNPRSWNSGPDTGSSAAARNVDDVGFLRALIKQWVKAGRVDRRRVYLTGFSNGAGMAFRAGAELSDTVAAIAPVANALLAPEQKLSRPVSLILIWGDADPVNPYAGGQVGRQAGMVRRPGAKAALEQWRSLLACAEPPLLERIHPTVTRTAYAHCAQGAAAQLYSVAGMGHQWPGGKARLRRVSGPGSDAIDATEVIWRFFASHPAL